MFKFLKSLFSEYHPDKFPDPETTKPKVIAHGQGTSSGYKIEPILPWPSPPTATGTNCMIYGSENVLKKLPKRDSKGRFSK
jgi:hypothetical protein